jgi:uncharacterized protein
MSFKRLCRNLPWLFGAVFSILLLVQPVGLAQSVNDWQSPHQRSGEWISDRANLLSWQAEHHLNRRINKLTGRTGAELAIATLPQLEAGQSAHAFALNLFNAWGVGNRDTNNGVLLFVSKVDRRIEIITGTGLSETLPDQEVRRLIQQDIVPALQRQDYATGMIQGTNAIAQRLEARLPSTILPSWLPAVFVWVPWVIAIAGVGLAIVGTVQTIGFSLTRVRVSVPTQGMDTQTFSNSSDQLVTYPFPKLLAKLFTPNDRDWHQEIPEQPLSYVWAGGLLLGIGLIQGFWQFVLMHSEAELWQSDVVAWGVYAFASSAWLLWGSAVTSRFVKPVRFWRNLFLQLVLIAMAALIGGYVWAYQVPGWGKLLTVMFVFFIVGWLAWRIIVGDDLTFKRRRDYCSDQSGKPVQELTAQELDWVLRTDEKLAQSIGKLEFRGWREAEISLSLTRELVYLVRRSDYAARTCRRCESFAVETSERTIDRTIESTDKIERRQEKSAASVIQVKQTVYSCLSCDFVEAYDQIEAPVTSGDDSSGSGSDYSNFSSYSSSSDYSNSDYNNNYDNTYNNNDYSSSFGNDFGGGSSDGGGAGSDW